ncbi:MAG TPA: hypothetical protein VE890_05380, partial [Thermoguttaceae bacterium]|nr:hypothetical protein [Thermoguttaceae bacterium]
STSETRLERVKSTLVDSQDTLDTLAHDYRLRAYLSADQGRLHELRAADEAATDRSPFDAKALASQLSAEATVTALGAGLEEVGRRHRGRLLAGVVLVSDFNENSGVSALTACRELGAPIYTVGVGAREAPDAAVSLYSDLVIKKDEQRRVTVQIRQSGLDGSAARLELVARRLGSVSGAIEEDAASTPIGVPRTVDFAGGLITVDIPYMPDRVGRYRLEASLETLDGEIITENNVASREVVVRDEAVKLLFIEDQPTWEWRFVKEVFHRDRLVGHEGFRTYLHSADFGVRRTSELFLTSLSPSRAEFFANDVIFVSDIPAELLTPDLQDMLVEYVRDFGGGLVVIAGPRFTASSLSQTKLGDMLPVILDPAGRPRVGPFRLQLTPAGKQEDFMILAEEGLAEQGFPGQTFADQGFADQGFADQGFANQKAWDTLGELPWYQPVANLHPQGFSLAVHPLDRCADGQTPQPIIATRRFGKGEVVYLGINEMWRLRRFHDEKYYRRFWGQLMYRLGLSHALGSQKRFKVATDREDYRVGDTVTVTAEAYDRNFRPLSESRLTGRLLFTTNDGSEESQPITIPSTGTAAVFETSVPVFTEGAHRLLVSDPVGGEEVEVSLNVSPLSVERRSAIRNVALQQSLASETSGRTYELNQLAKLTDDIAVDPIIETSRVYVPLWNTWLVVALVLVTLLGEWTIRKLADLS